MNKMGRKTDKFFDWLASKTNPPRFWTKEEWFKLNSKEKLWVLYKHHDNLLGIGNGELDRFLPFLKGDFITSLAAVSSLLILIKAPEWVFWVYPIFYMVIWKAVQWWVGNKLDEKDLIALQTEIGNKRNKVFRELRKKRINRS